MQKNFFIFSFIILTSATLATATQKTNKLVDALTQNTHAIATPQGAPTITAKRVVSVTNNIKPEMLVKKHWTGNYKPNPFAIIIDGKTIEPGKTATVSIANNTLPIQFRYSFMNGYRKGENEVTFAVQEKQDNLALTFCWENEYRIILDNAKPLQKKPISNCQSS